MTEIEKQITIKERSVEEFNAIMKELLKKYSKKYLFQNEFHEFDVYEHTKEFVKHLLQILNKENQKIDFNLIAAGWLHDIGKPITAIPKVKDGIIQERESGKPYHKFTNHEIEGEKIVKEMDPEIFKNLCLDQMKIASLVRYHFLPMIGIEKMRGTKNWNEFQQEYIFLKKELEEISKPKDRASVSKEEILLMFLADKLAQGDPKKYVTDQEELFAIRNALLLKDKDQEEEKLKEIYELQKREAEKNKQYTIKE